MYDRFTEFRDKKNNFLIFYFNARNQEIKRDIISIGSLNASLVHPPRSF